MSLDIEELIILLINIQSIKVIDFAPKIENIDPKLLLPKNISTPRRSIDEKLSFNEMKLYGAGSDNEVFLF